MRDMDWQIDAVGVTPATDLKTYSHYVAAVSPGVPDNLGYLLKNAACRRDFEALMPETQSVVCCALHMPELPEDLKPFMARFCGFGDYHTVVRNRLTSFAKMLCEQYGVTKYRVCVDSAPILERELAVRAGLGKIGHNRMMIHPSLGSYVALGEILVDVDLMPHAKMLERLAHVPNDSEALNWLKPGKTECCTAGCRRCTAACPTGALTEQGYNFHRCLAYWTTQHKGDIPEDLAQAMGGMIWGCDRCQTACPRARGCLTNEAARMTHSRHSDAASAYADEGRIAQATPSIHNADDNPKTLPGEHTAMINGMRWAEMLEMSAGQLRRGLAGSAMGDAHPYMVQRNLCIVIGNLGFWHYEKTLHKVAQEHACDWVKRAAWRALNRFENGGC